MSAREAAAGTLAMDREPGFDSFPVDDPATGDIVAHVPRMGAREAAAAVDAAAAALPGWSARPAIERADILLRFHAAIARDAGALAALLSREQGKSLAEARDEIANANAYVRWYAEEARRAYGEVIPAPARDRRMFVLRQPIGVVAAITPWNFPAAMVTRKVAPALAAGCTVVLKPAEQTPLTALALADLAEEAGVPSGVLTVVTGDAAEIGRVWTASPVVRKISFTGSTEIGSLLYGQSAATIKKLSLELGGNAPFIVFDDADLDLAVAGALAAKFRNAGQTCICPNRFLVQSAIHDAFVDALADAAATLEVGPLIDLAAAEKVERLVAEAVAHGARLVAGGRREGRRYAPTVLSRVPRGAALLGEEIFGPVAAIVRFENEEEAISLANATPFGLAAYLYSRDQGRIWRVAEAIEAGMIGVNTGHISSEAAPFGGMKASGLGREGSRHGLEEYLELKYVCLDL